MGLINMLFKDSEGKTVDILGVLLGKNNLSNYIYTMAEAHAIDLIARTIAKCEIQTFEDEKGEIKKKKGNLYWTLNLQPNPNDTGTSFIYKLVTKLLSDSKALVIINETKKTNYLYVADSYDTNNMVLKGKTFSNIKVSDNEGNSIDINKTYDQDSCIYYSLINEDLSKASIGFKENAGKLLKVVQSNFLKANTGKWRLKSPGGQPRMLDIETKKEMSYTEYKEKLTEGLFSEEDAIVLLSEMFEIINLNKDNNKNTSDLENIITKIGNTVAQRWNIPLDIFYGNKTEKSTGTNDFITFGVDPYFELLEDGFNVSLVGKESILKGEYIKFNRLNINHKDLIDKASGWDKLISNGFSFNQLSEFLGLPTIHEDWADEHYITKNYANVKGGAEGEE